MLLIASVKRDEAVNVTPLEILFKVFSNLMYLIGKK